MLAKTISPYVEFVRNKYPQLNIVEFFPTSIGPQDVIRVIYGNDMIEIIFKSKGALTVAILSQDVGQLALMRLKKQIASRAEPLDRVEDWECRCVQDCFDMGMQFRLIESRMTEDEKEERDLLLKSDLSEIVLQTNSGAKR